MIWLDAHDDITPFPDVERALRDPDGLLAIGGNLSKERLLKAYRRGIFPWYNAGQPILWWSPDPRTVLWPDDIRISRSLAKTLRKNPFSLTMDRRFFDVITACAAPRHGQHGTWITTEMQRAYLDLHRAGYAHSVEVLRDDVLVGGLYGVAVGGMFFGESMFSHMADASKVGLVHLAAQLRARGFLAIDCQTRTDHLIRMGAQAIPRSRFKALLRDARRQADRHGSWSFEPAILTTLSRSRPTSNRPAPDGGQQRTRLDARNPGR